MDIIYALIKRKIMDDMALLQGKKIARSALFSMAGVLLLNNALILLALSLYNTLLSFAVTAITAALVSGMAFLVIALGFFFLACKSFSYRHRENTIFISDIVQAFLKGLGDKR